MKTLEFLICLASIGSSAFAYANETKALHVPSIETLNQNGVVYQQVDIEMTVPEVADLEFLRSNEVNHMRVISEVTAPDGSSILTDGESRYPHVLNLVCERSRCVLKGSFGIERDSVEKLKLWQVGISFFLVEQHYAEARRTSLGIANVNLVKFMTTQSAHGKGETYVRLKVRNRLVVSPRAKLNAQFVKDGSTLVDVERGIGKNIVGSDVAVTGYTEDSYISPPMRWFTSRDGSYGYRKIAFEFTAVDGRREKFHCQSNLTNDESFLVVYACSDSESRLDKHLRINHFGRMHGQDLGADYLRVFDPLIQTINETDAYIKRTDEWLSEMELKRK